MRARRRPPPPQTLNLNSQSEGDGSTPPIKKRCVYLASEPDTVVPATLPRRRRSRPDHRECKEDMDQGSLPGPQKTRRQSEDGAQANLAEAEGLQPNPGSISGWLGVTLSRSMKWEAYYHCRSRKRCVRHHVGVYGEALEAARARRDMMLAREWRSGGGCSACRGFTGRKDDQAGVSLESTVLHTTQPRVDTETNEGRLKKGSVVLHNCSGEWWPGVLTRIWSDGRGRIDYFDDTPSFDYVAMSCLRPFDDSTLEAGQSRKLANAWRQAQARLRAQAAAH